jgi:hypothetical protein
MRIKPVKHALMVAIQGKDLDRKVTAHASRRKGVPRKLRELHRSRHFALFSLPKSAKRLEDADLSVSAPGAPEAALESNSVAVLMDSALTTLPLTIGVVANPFYTFNGQVRRDPILLSDDLFKNQLSRLLDDLYKRGAYSLLVHPEISSKTRIFSLFDPSFANVTTSAAAEDLILCQISQATNGLKIEASRRRVQAYLQRYSLWSDVTIVLSGAPSAQPTGWFGTDNYARGGVEFQFEHRVGLHCYYSALPGVVAFSARPIRPYEGQHELFHALSAYNSGQVLDEYDLTQAYSEPGVSSPFAINKKFVAGSSDLPNPFATYNGNDFPAGSELVMGQTLAVPKPSPQKLCLMRSLAYDPIPDPLIYRFMIDRLLARISREY